MTKGSVWNAEWRNLRDPTTGSPIRQLTDYLGHSWPLYFTSPCWFDQGRKLLFASDRGNRSNLFSLDLVTGKITQLTDLEKVPGTDEAIVTVSCSAVNPTRDEAYYCHQQRVFALDLSTLNTRVLWEMPSGFIGDLMHVSADGRFVLTSIFEDLSARFRIDYDRGYVGFAETYEAHPLSRIIRIAVDGTGGETVLEQHEWIGHVNPSPTQPHLLSFCHEGPWIRVDNRIWGLDLTTGNIWKIRLRESDKERIGHEYWFHDGLHLGYHGTWPDGRYCIGRIKYDNTDHVETAFPQSTGHTHSHDGSLIVGDGGKEVRLWQWNGNGYDGPRCLCRHNASQHVQMLHVHPRFTPDGKQILYSSSVTGYGNLYLVDILDFDSLPLIED